jgi:predicted flap endonuclease-1-like 5' DNA nuclease
VTYTLVTGLAWFVLAFVAGAAISAAVVLTSTRRRPEPEPAADPGTAAAAQELASARARIAELERERVAADGTRAREQSVQARDLEHVVAERDRLRRELEALHHGRSVVSRLTSPPVVDAAPVDTVGATDVVGHHVVADDLTEIVGIEEHVALLCHWIGIHTWRDLAATPVEQLRTMLGDAGSRFAHLDPTTWPEQAALLSQGRWDEFAALAARLRGTAADPV